MLGLWVVPQVELEGSVFLRTVGVAHERPCWTIESFSPTSESPRASELVPVELEHMAHQT